MTLRPYQATLTASIREQWANGHKDVLAVLPTGGGKTKILSEIVNGHRGACAIMAHRTELVSQVSLALARDGVRHNIVAARADCQAIAALHSMEFGKSFFDPNAMAAVASVQTLVRRKELDAWRRSVTLRITDEGHHATQGSTWGKCIEGFEHPQCVGLGLTATPKRADGKGLGRYADGYFDVMTEGPNARWLMDNGYLTRYKVACVDSHIEEFLGEVAASGDWSNAALKNAVGHSQIVGDVVKSYRQFANGKLGITFCTDVETAGQIARSYRDAGISAEVLTGETDGAVRRAILQNFRARRTLQIVAVDVISEGFDLPACEVITLARPTASLAVFLQQLGRGLRPMYAPGHDLDTLDGRFAAMAMSPKGMHCQIIDHVGNFLRHSGGPDTPRFWSLDRREKKKNAASEIPIRICLNTMCGQPYERFRIECPYCGTPAPAPAGRNSPEQVDGDLVLLDEAVLARLRGDVAAVDMSAEDYRHKLVAARCPAVGLASNVNAHIARQDMQTALRTTMAIWGGQQKARGLSDREMQKAFYLQYGLSVIEAQALASDAAAKLLTTMST